MRGSKNFLYTEKILDSLTDKSLSVRILQSSRKLIFNLGEDRNRELYAFLNQCWDLGEDLESIINMANFHISSRTRIGSVLLTIASFRMLSLGPGELLCIMLFKSAYSGGNKKPDILFKRSNKRIEVKSYQGKFRTTEATSFFTDLGAIIQALVQGGFLHSLTEITPSELSQALEDFKESLLSPRGYILWKGGTWKIDENSNKNTIIFHKKSRASRKYGNYSAVRNSLRNWLGRGILSIKLGKIIDPERIEDVRIEEVEDYIKELKGEVENCPPITLEQYYHLCGLSGIIIFDEKTKSIPLKLYKLDDLAEFKIRAISQGKVEYIRKKN